MKLSEKEFIRSAINSFTSGTELTQVLYKKLLPIPSVHSTPPCPAEYLIKDVYIWDPASLDETLVLNCPSCEYSSPLHAIRWKDGSKKYEGPRILNGLYEDAYLVSRVYSCKKNHQIVAHDPSVMTQIEGLIEKPFVLFHKTGVTKELYDYFICHSNTGLDIKTIQSSWNQIQLNYFCQKKRKFVYDCKYYSRLNITTYQEGDFPSFNEKGVQIGVRVITSCIITSYYQKETLYNARMSHTTAKWLSADHTFKVPANIGFWKNGKWVKVYDTLFIIINENGVVNGWKLCKGSKFSSIRSLLEGLQQRFVNQNSEPILFFIDNCCHWRNLLQEVFPNILVKLDIFHAIQRIIQQIPKNSGTIEMRMLRKKMRDALRMVIRDSTDIGKVRSMATPNKQTICEKIESFLSQWKKMECNEQLILPQDAFIAIEKLQKHASKGCLSEIPVSGGTNRNEAMHRLLNKIIRRSRIGIVLANALLGLFFYRWNERKIAPLCNCSNITYPVEYYFDKQINTEFFGASIYNPKINELNMGEEIAIFSLLNSAQEENDIPEQEEISTNSHETETDFIETDILAKAKNFTKLMKKVNSVCGESFAENKYNIFLPASLCLLTVDTSCVTELQNLDNLKRALSFESCNISRNSDSIFMAILASLEELTKKADYLKDSCTCLNLKFTDQRNDIRILKKLVVQHWFKNEKQYSSFVRNECFDEQVALIEKDECFQGSLSCSTPLALSNIFGIPIVIITGLDLIPLVPICPANVVTLDPIWLSYSGGFFDLLISKESIKSVPNNITVNQEIKTSTYCRCGRGAKKNDNETKFCNSYKSKCPCYRSIHGCGESCKCRNCANSYGLNDSKATSSSDAKRTRRANDISTKVIDGESVAQSLGICPQQKWSNFEEIILVEILKALSDFGNIDIDNDIFDYYERVRAYSLKIKFEYDINERSLGQLCRKLKEIYASDAVFRKLLVEQARLCIM